MHKLLLHHHSIHHTIFASQICSLRQLHLFTIYTPISCNRRGVDVVSFIKNYNKTVLYKVFNIWHLGIKIFKHYLFLLYQ